MLFLFIMVETAFSKTPPIYLFFQTASEGTLTKLHKQNYLLALDSLKAQVHYFNVSKRKQAGTMPLAQFLSLWRETKLRHHFVNNPPSAIISMVSQQKEKQQIFVAVISNPGFDKGIVNYQISVLEGQPIELGKFKSIDLYFEDIRWNPNELITLRR